MARPDYVTGQIRLPAAVQRHKDELRSKHTYEELRSFFTNREKEDLFWLIGRLYMDAHNDEGSRETHWYVWLGYEIVTESPRFRGR